MFSFFLVFDTVVLVSFWGCLLRAYTRITSPGWDLVFKSLRLPSKEVRSLLETTWSWSSVWWSWLAVVREKTSSVDAAVSLSKPLRVGHLSDSRHIKTSPPPPTPWPADDLRGVVGTPWGHVEPTDVAGIEDTMPFDSSSNVTIFSRGFITI